MLARFCPTCARCDSQRNRDQRYAVPGSWGIVTSRTTFRLQGELFFPISLKNHVPARRYHWETAALNDSRSPEDSIRREDSGRFTFTRWRSHSRCIENVLDFETRFCLNIHGDAFRSCSELFGDWKIETIQFSWTSMWFFEIGTFLLGMMHFCFAFLCIIEDFILLYIMFIFSFAKGYRNEWE